MSTFDIKKAAEDILYQRRQSALTQAAINLDDLSEDKEFRNAYGDFKEAELNLVKAEYLNTEIADKRDQVAAAQEKLNAVFAKKGLSQEFILPQYVCKKCCDTGSVGGKICSCKKELILDLTFKNRRTTTRDFSCDTETNPQNKAVIKEAKLWCEKFPNVAKPNYLLCGHTGVGKTFLADCIATALVKKGAEVVYLTSYQLADALKENFFADNSQVLNQLTTCKTLIIDDLGKEPIYRKIYLESLFCLLNERQINRLSTIVTTNLFGEGLLERYGEGIFARLANKQTTMVRMLVGEDKRTIGGKK